MHDGHTAHVCSLAVSISSFVMNGYRPRDTTVCIMSRAMDSFMPLGIWVGRAITNECLNVLIVTGLPPNTRLNTRPAKTTNPCASLNSSPLTFVNKKSRGRFFRLL